MIVLTVAIGLVAVFVAVARKKERESLRINTELNDLALEVGGKLRQLNATSAQLRIVRGAYNLIVAHRNTLTDLDAKVGPIPGTRGLWIRIEPRSMAHQMERALGIVQVRTDDVAFDQTFDTTASCNDAARAFLTPAVRLALSVFPDGQLELEHEYLTLNLKSRSVAGAMAFRHALDLLDAWLVSGEALHAEFAALAGVLGAHTTSAMRFSRDDPTRLLVPHRGKDVECTLSVLSKGTLAWVVRIPRTVRGSVFLLQRISAPSDVPAPPKPSDRHVLGVEVLPHGEHLLFTEERAEAERVINQSVRPGYVQYAKNVLWIYCGRVHITVGLAGLRHPVETFHALFEVLSELDSGHAALPYR